MGHNYARDNRKRRLKRAKKEDKKLDAWAKRVIAQLRTLYDRIYLIEADCQLKDGTVGRRRLYLTHISEEQKAVGYWDLPEPMNYFNAVKYVDRRPLTVLGVKDVELPTELPNMQQGTPS